MIYAPIFELDRIQYVEIYYKGDQEIEMKARLHDPRDDFESPKLPEGRPLRKHALYRISQREWQTHMFEKVHAINGQSIGLVELVFL